MGNIIAQRRQKSKGHIGVQLRLFEHSLNAGLCLLFEVWRWWDGQNLLSGLLEKKGKPNPSLLLAYAARWERSPKPGSPRRWKTINCLSIMPA